MPGVTLDCHKPSFGWIMNDCLGTTNIVLHSRWHHETRYTEHSLIILSHVDLVKFARTLREIFWSQLPFHANHWFSIMWHKLPSLFALTDKIQAEFDVFESIAGLWNWLPPIFIRGMRVPDHEEQKIGVLGWSLRGGHYYHLNRTSWSWSWLVPSGAITTT
jgi:hypothetical protein